MSWVRIHDGAMTHPKLIGLSDKAFRLWVWGLSYCQTHLTDGVIPSAAIPPPPRMATVLVLAHLWDAREAGGYVVHDYLDWNDSREFVQETRRLAKARMVLVRDPDIRSALRFRDRDICRYCGDPVNWADRKSARGATYDHVIPRGGDTLENLVTACRSCNSRKNRRTPEQAGMTVRPPPDLSVSVSRFSTPDINVITRRVGLSTSSGSEGESEGKPLDDIAQRAGILLQRYADLFSKHRNGAKLRLIGNSLEFQEACSLVKLWALPRLEKLAVLVLTTDDPFISATDRGFKIFALKATWADDKLKLWELEHGVTA